MRDRIQLLILSLLIGGLVSPIKADSVHRYHVNVSIKEFVQSYIGQTRHIEKRTIREASGTIVNEQGVVVTAAHVARSEKDSVHLTDFRGYSYEADVVRIIPNSDLAILQITSSWEFPIATPPLNLNPEPGTRITALGIDTQNSLLVRNGTVQPPRDEQHFRFAEYSFRDPVIINMAVQPGFSGGAVFDSEGRWLGVLVGYAVTRSDDESTINTGEAYVIPADRILGFIDEVK